MNLIKKHLSIKLALLVGLVFSFAVLPSQSWAAFTIDSYNAPACTWSNVSNINNVNLLPNGERVFYRNIGTLGGQGEFYFYADALNSPGKYGIKTFIHFRQACTRLNQLFFTGNTEADNFESTGLSDGGYVRILYDGKDNDIGTNSFGLGNIDLTEGGINNIFRLVISTSHWKNTVDLRIYTDADNYSEALDIFVPNTGNVYRNFDIRFSEFVQGTEASGPADFTNVNAIELQLNHPRTTGGSPLTVFGVPVGYGVGLDNFGVNKQLVATLSSGFSESSPGDDINGDGDFDSTSTDADIVTYTVEITNTVDWHYQAADGVIYTAGFSGPNASFIDGSVYTSQGTVTNETGSVEVDIGSIADGKTVIITYKVQIATGVLAPNQQYSHRGTVQTSDGLQFDTAEDLFTINQFDISASLVAAPAVGSDTDGDGFSGPGESVTFTATVTNEGPNTTSSVVFYFPEIANASLVTGSVSTNYGTVILGNNSAHTEVEVTISNFPAAAIATISFDMQIDDPFFFGFFDSIGGQALLTDSTGRFSVWSDDPNEPGDADPTYIRVDAFPGNAAASVDNDNDGMPDEWNEGCDQSCQAESGLILDPYPNDTNNDGVQNDPDNPLADDDGDGVPNGEDAFPFIVYASKDMDGDDRPDGWNPGTCDVALPAEDPNSCESLSGLSLDPDIDGDGVSNEDDAFPDNVYASKDMDGDGRPDEWNSGTCDLALPARDPNSCESLSGLILDPDIDGDGVPNGEDAFPFIVYASKDMDGDGRPDEWNEGTCDTELDALDQNSCESLSGLTLDPDIDGDGVLNEDDAFPLNPYAAVDEDKDGLPDEWVTGSCDETLSTVDPQSCESLSGLTLDPYPNDTNNDGVPNDPDNPLADDDGDCILNGDEKEGFELIDDKPPVVIAPADRTVNASGTLTSVSLGEPVAYDCQNKEDVVLPLKTTEPFTFGVKADNRGPFSVGVHTVTWKAVDAAGNVSTDTQTVTVIGQDEGASGNGSGGGGGGSVGSGGGGGSLGLFTLVLMLVLTAKRFATRRFINAR